MGIYDRDYYRQPPRRSNFAAMGFWSVNTWLIVLNVAVFIVNNLIVEPVQSPYGFVDETHPLFNLGYFSVQTSIFGLQAWRFLTFQFLHANPSHIFFNMLSLGIFGPIVEGVLGARRYLAFYLLSGIAGPICYTLLWAIKIPIGGGAVPMIGASAGIFGVLVAAAIIAPDTKILLDFIFPVTIRTLAWVMLAFAIYRVITPGQSNAGGEAAHLGGAAAGFALLKNPQLLNFVVPRKTKLRYRP